MILERVPQITEMSLADKIQLHDELWQEIAFLAYHLHWDLDRLLDLEHGDRIRLLREVGGLNERAWQGVQGG